MSVNLVNMGRLDLALIFLIYSRSLRPSFGSSTTAPVAIGYDVWIELHILSAYTTGLVI